VKPNSSMMVETKRVTWAHSDMSSLNRGHRAVGIIRENALAYGLLLPLIFFLILLMWYPFLKGIWISFHRWPFMGQTHAWVGLSNYTWFIKSGYLGTSIVATLVYIGGTFLQLAIAVIAAVAVDQKFVRGKTLWHGICLLPYSMPPVVTGVIWLFLLDPDLGMVQHYLQKFSVLSKPVYWMVATWPARVVVTWCLSWTFWPFMFVIIYAALRSIPQCHYEAAEIYGASWWTTTTKVVLPQIKNSVLIAVIVRLSWNLSKISQVLQMTQGGPGYDTSILPVFMYREAYSSSDFGKAYAIGMFLLILIIIIISPIVKMVHKAFKES
jgi:multiple sugar transport system permease protein